MANRQQTSEVVRTVRKRVEDASSRALSEMQALARTAGRVRSPRRLPYVRDELAHHGVTNVSIAEAMAKGLAYLDHPDLGERYFGLSMLRLVLKVRGDLTNAEPRTHGGGGSAAPVNLAVFVTAIRELRTSPTEVAALETTAAHEVSYAADTNRSISVEDEDS